jgi:transcriptional regulator with XRE-family HTH domain
MGNTSSEPIRDRDKFYYRQRNKNRVFEKIITLFAEEAERQGITKKQIAERLKSDPAQINRWLSAPGNLTLDSVSDLLLALDSEMDYLAIRFSERAKPNYVHPLMAQPLQDLFSVRSTAASTSLPRHDEQSFIVVSSGAVQAKSLLEAQNA